MNTLKFKSLDSNTNWDLKKQKDFWNEWDRRHLSPPLDREALRRGDLALKLLQSLHLSKPNILELGCGNGWLVEKLISFGPVTGIDIAGEAIAEARRRIPSATFYAGDASSLNLPIGVFDIVVTLETFSHVPSQPKFIELMARVLKPNGSLILTTQNRAVYCRNSQIRPPAEGQLRRWVTMRELRVMLRPYFRVVQAFTIQPSGDRGFLRIVNATKINYETSSLSPLSKVE